MLANSTTIINTYSMYARFQAPVDYTEFEIDQIEEYSAAAERHYSPDHPYHNYETHAVPVAEGVRTIAAKLAMQGIIIPTGALVIAAHWHDAEHHQDHRAKGYMTKEEYSAHMVEMYLEDKPVTKAQGIIIQDSILATEHNFWRHRYPYETILHRADIENIGGPTIFFLQNVALLYKEALIHDATLSWDEYVTGAVEFLQTVIDEHDEESRWHNLNREDTTVDVHDTPFRAAAESNIAALLQMEDPY